jgi:2-amino-4-hydroxy-6-hydroxymethyldihydropteridine diphosphokinase
VRQAVEDATERLEATPGLALLAVSPLFGSKPVDADGPDYVNGVIGVRSCLGPHELLAVLMGLERQADRQRPYRHAPRTLDLDLLWYGAHTCSDATLVLPHPRMMRRAFVLAPWLALFRDLNESPQAACPDIPWPDEAQLAELQKNQGLWPI